MFHYLVKEDEFLPVKELDETGLEALNSDVRRKILEKACSEDVRVSDLVESLNLDRQTAYYHLEKLQGAGVLDSEGSRPKVFSADPSAYYFKPNFVESEENPLMLENVPEILRGFVENRRIKTRIVVGAPYPHGENNRRHRTSYLAADLACQLGNYGSRSKQLIYSDVQAEKLEEEAEVMIGGFRVNERTKQLYKEFPIKFSSSGDEVVMKNGNSFTGADTGYIVRGEVNGKPKMILAGISGLGTSAAVRAVASRIDELGDKGAIVKGYGTKENIEEVRILEKLD